MDAPTETNSENTSSSVLSTAKCHESLWLSDGNVVLTTNTLLFRVHKSVLAMRSSVFKDMFAFPTVEDLEAGANVVVGIVPDLYEGLPVVALTDEGKEVEHLLKAIYEPRYYNTAQDHHSFEKVEALMKLSFKYNFQALRLEVVDHLARIYPIFLSKYENIQQDHPLRLRLRPGRLRNKSSKGLLQAAIEAGIDDLFPALYYAFAQVPFSTLRTLIPNTPAGWAALDRIVAGRNELSMAGPRIMSKVVEITERCIVEHRLKRKDSDAESDESEDSDDEDEAYDSYAWDGEDCYYFNATDLRNLTTENFMDLRNKRLGVCEPCKTKFEEEVEAERSSIWEDIPEFFGFINWGTARTKLATWMKNNA